MEKDLIGFVDKQFRLIDKRIKRTDKQIERTDKQIERTNNRIVLCNLAVERIKVLDLLFLMARVKLIKKGGVLRDKKIALLEEEIVLLRMRWELDKQKHALLAGNLQNGDQDDAKR